MSDLALRVARMLRADSEPQLAPKAPVILQDTGAVIDSVAKGHPMDRWLTDQEFSDRYMALMQAYRNGVMDNQQKDEGLEFLLDHWQHEKQEKPNSYSSE